MRTIWVVSSDKMGRHPRTGRMRAEPHQGCDRRRGHDRHAGEGNGFSGFAKGGNARPRRALEGCRRGRDGEVVSLRQLQLEHRSAPRAMGLVALSPSSRGLNERGTPTARDGVWSRTHRVIVALALSDLQLIVDDLFQELHSPASFSRDALCNVKR